MRRISLIVALLLVAAPSFGAAGGRSILVRDPERPGPGIGRAAPPTPHPHRRHGPFHHRLFPGVLGPGDLVLVPSDDAAERDDEPAVTEAPRAAMPATPPATPSAEPKILLPPAASQPDPPGVRTIVIQRGDRIEVLRVPSSERP